MKWRGGEAKPAREARGPGVHARGGSFPGPLGPVEGTMDRGPSGREAAGGIPLHGGEIWKIWWFYGFASSPNSLAGGRGLWRGATVEQAPSARGAVGESPLHGGKTWDRRRGG